MLGLFCLTFIPFGQCSSKVLSTLRPASSPPAHIRDSPLRGIFLYKGFPFIIRDFPFIRDSPYEGFPFT